MSHSNFGRGRGFGPRGSRAIGRPRFLRPPFRHIGPPRPGHPASFGMPWQPNNMMFQPHGNLQFRPAGGRRRRICNYDIRFPPPNRLPVPPDCEEVVPAVPSNSSQLENNQIAPQTPLIGSEEERQQKTAKTVDRFKQKLSCFNSDEMTNIWSDDVSLPFAAENDCTKTKTLGSELNLTHDGLRDIGRISLDDSKPDMQHVTDASNITEDASVNVLPNDDIEVISNNETTNVENFEHQKNLSHDNNCKEMEQSNSSHELIDNSHNFKEQTENTDINAENQLLDSDIQCQHNESSSTNIYKSENMQNPCKQDHQQDIPQKAEVKPIALAEQDVTKTPNLQNMQFSIVSTEQDVLRNNLQKEPELVELEVQESVLNSTSNNSALSQSAPPLNVPVLNNVALDNRLPGITENSFHSGPPRLSPHIEQELPIDFDPTTPPPILVKQDPSVNILPPLLIHDLPPLFNPAEPPPNMRIGLKLSHENPTPTWNMNTQNQVPPVYNTEIHMDLNAHVGFTPPQLPLEMANQNNVFLAPPIDPMNFSSLFPIPPNSHPAIATNVPLLPQGQIVPRNACVPSSSPQEPLPFSDCNVDKDDVLNDMQEAMKFAQQMTSITESIAENTPENITEKNDEISKSDSTPGSESCINSVNTVELISLPPGKPKSKPVKLKRIKPYNMYSKKSEISEEQRISDNALSDEIIIQDDTNIKSKDVPIVNEQDRPKVVFNLNNKTIKVNAKTTWQENTRRKKREKKNGMTQARSETMRVISRKNLASTSKRSEEKKNFKRNERNINKIIPSETTAIQSVSSSHRQIQRNIYKENSQQPNVLPISKTNVQKLRNFAEKNKSSNLKISWKNNVINRFLKMSRNDIYNMVNNTSLRRFDVIMKRLVKEQKCTLALEKRQVQDEEMKSYNQQEFMKQLNAMLDTDTTVTATNLPTEFIQHLNEVLQLDVQLDSQAATTTLASQSSHSEDTSLNPATYNAECETTTANIAGEECVKNKSHVIKSICDKDGQTHNRTNDFNAKDDTCSTVISNKSSISSKLSALQHDLDDIFSEVTKKNHVPIAIMRKDCIAGQRSAKKFDDDASSKNTLKESFLEDDRARRSENCARWIEKCDKWKKKEREDPYTYRNLTKEEWEAKYGTQANTTPSFLATASCSTVASSSAVTSSSITTFPAIASSTKLTNVCNKSLSIRSQDENFYPRRRHSSESSKHSTTRYKTMEKDKHKRSRRHSDDRKHSAQYTENNSNSSESSSSSSSSTSSDSDSDNSDREANVTKLLRVIKENEKVAKKMSLNEAIRDEVNAEIERERKQKSKKSRKSRKNAKRKARRMRHKKKKKQSKKTSTSSDSFSDKDNNEETTRLLTESEIKKEIIEDQIQQQVIIKEEIDIGQEENIEYSEFANISDHIESHDNLASPLTQETLAMTAGIVQSYSEDKQPAASPTQPKTKAQLKQMPADMNDNKVPLNVFTTIPESLILGDISENLRKTREAIDISCNQSTTEVSSAVNNLTSQSDAINDIALHNKPNESTISHMDDTAHTSFTDLSTINIQNEVSICPNVSSKTSSVPIGISIGNTITQKQGTSKKIDIKTYYERTIQRRMNEQAGGSKKSTENSAASKQDSLFIQKSAEPEIVINKSTSSSTYDNSVQDEHLVSPAGLAIVPCLTNNKDSVGQIILEKNVLQEQKRVTSEPTESILKHPLKHTFKRDFNRPKRDFIKADDTVKKIDQNDKPEKKATLIKANTSINPTLSNVMTKPKTASLKLKRHSRIEKNATEKLQTEVPKFLEPKKFKNIRSEGGKELKLKKEMMKTLKAKKKFTVSPKFDLNKSLGPIKVRYSSEHAEKVGKVESKSKRKNTEEDNDARERLPSKTLNDANDAAAVEIEDKKVENTKEIANSVSKFDVSMIKSKIVLEAEASSNKDNLNREDLLVSNEIRSSNAMKVTELIPLNPENLEREAKNSDKDLTESRNVSVLAKHDVNSIPESDISRSDNIDKSQDMLANTYKSIEEDSSELRKTESSSTSNKNSEEQHSTIEAITPESIGSPFKGFLQESIMTFEQSNLFKLELNEIDSDKEPAANEKTDVMPNEKHVRKSSDETITTILHNEDNDIDKGAEEQLGNERNYTLNTELEIKESMFIINEEEIIHDDVQPKDLTDKLTTTTDPSLSDAVDRAISDDPLRLPDSQSTEHLNNHIYLETNLSVEKPSCDKLQDFESDEHLVNDMFYLDDRLQGTFDNKDDTPSQFSIHQQSPRYDITPTVTPETTMIIPDLSHNDHTDLSHEMQKSEQCEFDFKRISSVDNDLLTKTLTEHSSLRIVDIRRTLNIPTKAALKEAATELFLKSPNNVSTATEETTLRILDKLQQNETDLNYQTAWHSDVHHDQVTHVPQAHNNTTTQDSINVNAISSTQNNTNDGDSYNEVTIEQNKTTDKFSTPIKKCLCNIQRNPIIELQKIKELDSILKKKIPKSSEKLDANHKEQKKRKDSILHKIKNKQSNKYRSNKSNNNVTKKLKSIKQSENFNCNTRDDIWARMLEIDIEIHKLTMEKLKLHKILQNNSSIENSIVNNSTASTVRNDAANPVLPITSSISTSQLMQSTETNRIERDRHTPDRHTSRRSLIKQRRRVLSVSSEEDETTAYTQRSKTPVIKWKKKPRLELMMTAKRKENEESEEEEEEEDNDEKMAYQASTASTSKKVDSVSINAPENIQKDGKLDSNTVTVRDTREHEVDVKTNRRTDSDIDKCARHMIYLNKSASERNMENRSDSRQDSVERDAERADNFDVVKRHNIPNETVRANSQPKSMQVHSTPEPLSIYSDDSTWDSLVQNTASEMHEKRNSTGLALLDEALKKEQALTKRMKAIARKKKKKQLSNFLKSVDNLTLEEEELPLSKLYIRKLQQKRDLLDSLSQRKDDMNIIVDSKILKNVDEVINAVAENRVEDLYERQLETRASNDVPTTSNAPITSQSDKHQFYVDAEANANSDWACQERENIDQVVMQQDSNDMSAVDVSNHVFKTVSQNKVSFYNERNVEPDSSVTPEETLLENHSDCERGNSKNLNNIASCSFDIKVSMPKMLIKDNFSLDLLQKFKGTEVNIAGTNLVDSTTNTFSTSIEKSEENDKNSSYNLQTVKSLVEKDENGEGEMENTTKLIEKNKNAIDANDDKRNTHELQETTTTNNIENIQTDTMKSGYSDITESEDSDDSFASNRHNKITYVAHDSNPIIEKADIKERKFNAESEEQFSNNALRQDQNEENAIVKEEKNDARSKLHTFEKILDNDQSTTIPADRMSEKSEESNEMSVAQKSDFEYTSVSGLSFNKVLEKDEEASKKLRRKFDKSTPIRRSTRYITDNIKSNKINEMDINSNSSESESILHERNLIIRPSSKSPTEMLHDEKHINIKKNHIIPKEQNATNAEKTPVDIESDMKIENLVKPCLTTISEFTSSNDTTTITATKRKHTPWQMMNCKVKVIDCKRIFLKPDVHPEVLNKLGIIVNPYVSNDISYMQHAACDRDTVIMPTAVLEKNSSLLDKSCDKNEIEIEILEDKSKRSNDNDFIQESASHATEMNEQEPIRTQYTVHKGPILDIKIFGNSFLAASEDGKIYRYSQTSNGILNIYKGHKSAVTCLHIYKSDGIGIKKELMYSGSLDGTLRCYNIMTGGLVKSPAQVNSPIQCMDQAWGMIFVGTKSGHVSRFYVKGATVKGSNIQFSDNSVLALKATNEGPRKILIVASRSQPITIRDATSGLFLRTISSQKNHTVYSLMRHHNLIYCGTSSTSINVFDFTTGEQIIQYEAGVGIVCMRLYEQLLFAGCYDGNIYVFDTSNRRLICSIRGPGNMLLSLEVVNNKIIAGTKDKRLHSWQMPNEVRALLQKIS